eukprot:1152157-Pelagomonas_calceolata.AAC.5
MKRRGHVKKQPSKEPSEEKGGREGRGGQRTRKLTYAKKSIPGGAFKYYMPFIVHIILGITKITGRKNGIMPCSLLNFESTDAKTYLGLAAYNALGKPGSQRLVDERGKLSPVRQVTRPEIHYKPTQSRRLAEYIFCWRP